jgi:hypothetical protein
MQNKVSIEEHLEKLYRVIPSKTLKVKGVLESIIKFWEDKLKTL